MAKYTDLSRGELSRELSAVQKKYDEYKKMGLSLDLSRGKPNSDQLDISLPLLSEARPREKCFSENGVDCRNYGVLDGIPEMKRLFAEMLGIKEEYITVGGNSSLQLMYDTLTRAMLFGVLNSPRPWCRESGLKWICVAPGYDRHFRMTELLGFELITVNMTPTGPDMDEVEELIRDEKVKGIWCVPKYSNPEGITYSDEVVRRFANLKPAAKDFKIFWDNAYCIHDLYDEGDSLLNIYDECVKAGNPDLPIIFASTSKITFPGAGVAVAAGSHNNVAILKSRMKFQTIGPDKLNQLRHARMFKSANELYEHMKKHAAIIRPKFESVLSELNARIKDTGIAHWTNPNGGYFISLYVLPGCAKRVEQLCANAGLILTPAGAAYPYVIDPEDSNLRIAPTYPSADEIKTAAVILCAAVRVAALEKLIEI